MGGGAFGASGFLLSIGVVQLWGFDGLGSRFGGLGVSDELGHHTSQAPSHDNHCDACGVTTWNVQMAS